MPSTAPLPSDDGGHHPDLTPDGHEADSMLLGRAHHGDRDAFATLYRRHRGAARWVADRWTTSAHDAEDLVAESFTRVFAAVSRLDPEQVSFRPYLLASVRNAAHDRARRPPREDLWAEPPDARASSAHDNGPPLGTEAEFLAAALASLPPRWSQVLWHTVVEGRSTTEVAQAAGCSPGAIAAITYRARKRLREAHLNAHSQSPADRSCPACALSARRCA